MSEESTILVTGGAGYIGSHAVLALKDAGYPIIVLDDLSTGIRQAVPPEIAFVEGDAGDIRVVKSIILKNNVRVVVHFAGSIVVPESVSNPLKYYRNNTMISRNLIEACILSGVRSFVFSSTAAVYGEPEKTPIDEESIANPENPYGRSKLVTEWMLRDTAAAHDMRFVALRYFNVAGADPLGRTGQSTPDATHLIKVASQVVVGFREYIEVFGDDYDTPDGTCVRDYIHVSDLAEAHVHAVRHLQGGGESLVLNCGYGNGYSVDDVLRAVASVAGDALDIRRAARRPGDTAHLVADVRKIKAQFDWKPRYNNLELIVRSALLWERNLAAKSEQCRVVGR